jgi:hypothetical protein
MELLQAQGILELFYTEMPWSFRFCSLNVKERLVEPVNRFEKLKAALKRV